MAENSRIQLRSYVAALGTERAAGLLAEVRKAFENWPPDKALASEGEVQFFSTEAEGMLKVFVLIPLVDNEKLALNSTWIPALRATMEEDVALQLRAEMPVPKTSKKK